MLNLQAVDGLDGLRRALEAPEGEQFAIFREYVVEPLRPFWEPVVARRQPPSAGGEADPMLEAAHAMRLYHPGMHSEIGLAALAQLAQAGAWRACVEVLQASLRVLAPEAHGVHLDRMLFALALADPDAMDGRMGSYRASAHTPGRVMLAVWPDEETLRLLPAVTAHEVSHNIRFVHEPFPSDVTVGQYMVDEGLGDAFAAELLGEEALGPWANALSDQQAEQLLPRFRTALELRGVDVARPYILGDWANRREGAAELGLPNFAGYALGYRLVRAYLQRTGKSAAEAAYVGWREILEESRFFS